MNYNQGRSPYRWTFQASLLRPGEVNKRATITKFLSEEQTHVFLQLTVTFLLAPQTSFYTLFLQHCAGVFVDDAELNFVAVLKVSRCFVCRVHNVPPRFSRAGWLFCHYSDYRRYVSVVNGDPGRPHGVCFCRFCFYLRCTFLSRM